MVGVVKLGIEVMVMFVVCMVWEEGRRDGNGMEWMRWEFVVGIGFGKIGDWG